MPKIGGQSNPYDKTACGKTKAANGELDRAQVATPSRIGKEEHYKHKELYPTLKGSARALLASSISEDDLGALEWSR